MRLPKNHRPTHTREVFLEELLIPLDFTHKDETKRPPISSPLMDEIIMGSRSVTPDSSLCLARFTST